MKDAQTPTMESTNVESQEPLLHDQTQTTSSKLKPEASPKTPFPTASERPYRDSPFAFLFLTAILTTFAFGIIASTHTDTLNMDTKLRLSHFNPATNTCELKQQLQQHTPDDEDPDSPSAIVTLAAIALFTSLALTIPLSLLLISLVRRFTRPMVSLSAAMIALCPLGISIAVFSWCRGLPEGCSALGPVRVQLFYLIVLPAWSVVLVCELRKKWTGSAVEDGVQALRMATEVLKEHFVLQIVNPLLLVGWMVFVDGPIFLFMWNAFNVGEIVPDFAVMNDPTKGCEQLATGSSCCRGERPGWVYAYITFAIFTAFWVLWVSFALPQMVMSGVVSQWYFAPTGSSTTGNIKRSMRNAYGPLFGTTCNFGTMVTGMVVFIVGTLKEIGDQVLRSNCRSHILRTCFSWMSQFPKCHIVFVGVIASISGDSFWESSKKSYNLFIRNSLPSIALPKEQPFHTAIETLGMMTLISALLQTRIVYAVLQYFSNAVTSEANFLIATVLCFPLTVIWLGSLFSLTTSSVFITTHVCSAMEKAVGKVSKAEVCGTLLAIPPSWPQSESEATSDASLASEVHHHPAKLWH